MIYFQALHQNTLYNLLQSLRDEDFILLESTRGSQEDCRSLLFRNPAERLIFRVGSGDPSCFLRKAEKKLEQGYYLAGWIAYEFGYLLEKGLESLAGVAENTILADLSVFPEPSVFNHRQGVWDKPELLPCNPDGRQTIPGSYSYHIENIHPSQDQESYIHSVQTIKDYIAGGDTYQVNYTLKLLFDFSGPLEELYLTMRRNQSVSFGAFIHNNDTTIMSFSPELFFRKKGRTCTVRPMKGTIKRGRNVHEDRKIREFLQADAKNRSENVMIVDMLRNDLGRISEPGAVYVDSLFDVETYESLHQMTTTVKTTLREDLSLFELFQGLFPCGSVTGAPKIRTMEIIKELEEHPRGVYTGAIGFLAPDGEATFNVPIRTLTMQGGHGEMGIGSGIIHDSDPEKEWEECLLKAQFLTAPSEEFQLLETILWRPDGGYWLLSQHLDRMEESAAYFEFPFNRRSLVDRLAEEERTFKTAPPRKIRLLLDRKGQTTVESSLLDDSIPAGGRDSLPRIYLAEERVDSRQISLYHKTTSRSLYNRVYREAVSRGYYDVLFTNEKGEITEGAISTLFIRKEGRYYTPPVACGLLPGVFRQHFMETNPDVNEKILTPADILSADALYLANSVRGMVEVTLEQPT